MDFEKSMNLFEPKKIGNFLVLLSIIHYLYFSAIFTEFFKKKFFVLKHILECFIINMIELTKRNN